MKKIPTIFEREIINGKPTKLVMNEINRDCQWVFDDGKNGEFVTGVLKKLDGTCCMILDGELWKRRTVKAGKKDPNGFVRIDFDQITLKSFGWIKVDFECDDDKYFAEGWNISVDRRDGTYELVGPKINGNNENISRHLLLKHSSAPSFQLPFRTFEDIKQVLSALDVEGFIFTHPDGRMAKIKKSDFGLKRKPN